MSECFICQRTEGIIELPLGPFCVQCVKQIGKHYVALAQQDLLCWNQRSGYVASRLLSEGSKGPVDEWENRCSIIAICASNRDSKGIKATTNPTEKHENEWEAVKRITADLNRPPKREDTDQWMRRCDRLAKGTNRREGQQSQTLK